MQIQYIENTERFFSLLNIAGKSYESMLPGPTFKSVLSSALHGAFPPTQKSLFFSIFPIGLIFPVTVFF